MIGAMYSLHRALTGLSVSDVLARSLITVSGVNVGHLWGETEIVRATLDALLLLWREGKVKSHIDRVFPLAEGPAAHRRMHERKNVGKILFDCA